MQSASGAPRPAAQPYPLSLARPPTTESASLLNHHSALTAPDPSHPGRVGDGGGGVIVCVRQCWRAPFAASLPRHCTFPLPAHPPVCPCPPPPALPAARPTRTRLTPSTPCPTGRAQGDRHTRGAAPARSPCSRRLPCRRHARPSRRSLRPAAASSCCRFAGGSPHDASDGTRGGWVWPSRRSRAAHWRCAGECL